MKTHAVLAKHNKNRGLITWAFQTTSAGLCQATRNDGRVFPYASIEAMRDGYRLIRDQYHFVPVDI